MTAGEPLYGVCARTPDLAWLRARGGPFWRRRWLSAGFLLIGCASALVALAASAWTLSSRPSGAPVAATVAARQWLVPIFAAAFAVTFLPVALAPIVLRRLRLKLRTWLFLHGRRVHTELIGVVRQPSFFGGADRPYRILSRWRDPRNGRRYQFHSIDLWVDPSAWLPQGTIAVRIDPANPKRHDMDIAFVPTPVRDAHRA
jgi:hypothetical protein